MFTCCVYFYLDVYFLTSGASSPEWVKPSADTRQQQRRKPKAQKKNLPTTGNKNKLQELEHVIAELRNKIKLKEEARKNTNNSGSNQPVKNGWKVVNRNRRVYTKLKSLRISGHYKLVIRSADDGIKQDTQSIRNELCSECKNRTLIAQLAADQNHEFEY
jgi:hypothetical protein